MKYRLYHEGAFSSDHASGHRDGTLDPLLAGGNELSIQDRLQDAGVTDEAMPEVMAVLHDEAKRVGWHLTTEALAVIGKRLSKYSTHCASVAHALGIADGSLDALAAHFGCAKQAIGNSASELKRAFSGATVLPKPPMPIKRPDSPNGEVWMTYPEAHHLSGFGAVRLEKLPGIIRTRAGTRKFYEKASLVAAIGAYLRDRAKPENASKSRILNRHEFLHADTVQ